MSDTIAIERFQPIARQRSQVSEARRSIQPIKPHLGLPRKARELPDTVTGSKPLGALIPIGHDHR